MNESYVERGVWGFRPRCSGTAKASQGVVSVVGSSDGGADANGTEVPFSTKRKPAERPSVRLLFALLGMICGNGMPQRRGWPFMFESMRSASENRTLLSCTPLT